LNVTSGGGSTIFVAVWKSSCAMTLFRRSEEPQTTTSASNHREHPLERDSDGQGDCFRLADDSPKVITIWHA
jgi:hypothetical protein